MKYYLVTTRFVIEKKSMTVFDNTLQTEGFCNFFKNLGRSSAKTDEKLATKVIKNPGRAVEIISNNATAAATINPKIYYQPYQR